MGNRSSRSGFHADRRSSKCWCEWRDSNSHGVTHWYLNLVDNQQSQLCTRSTLIRSGDFPNAFNELRLFPIRILSCAAFAKCLLKRTLPREKQA
jgi:hypothetical protein